MGEQVSQLEAYKVFGWFLKVVDQISCVDSVSL